ncbi:MAG TPA: hypothetical protein VNO81_11655 [Candidatus Nitrosotenuis sp.]|nr:hypothetical protein [Candidatus Nitrosotenuis sp.]
MRRPWSFWLSLVLFAGLAFCLVVLPVEGAVVDPVPTTTTQVTNISRTVTNTITEKHRVISGKAAEALEPNFYDNDWDEGGNISQLVTDDEKAYLETLTDLQAGVRYYVDLTGQTYKVGPFQDKSEELGRESVTTTRTIQLDEVTFLEVHETVTTITVKETKYQVIANLYDYSPLVLDLNGDGRLDVSMGDWKPHAPRFHRQFARFFDITGDGTVDFTEWVAGNVQDGLLVMPEEGRVENALQLFGTAGGFDDGFQKLSIVCDRDRNGWIEGAELEGLALWVDANVDGVCQPSEMHSLAEYRVSRISTSHSNYLGSYVTADGQKHTMWDWWPSVLETRVFRAE